MRNVRVAFDRQFQFSIQHMINLLLRMEMLMNTGCTIEIIVRHSHVLRMKESPAPPRKALDHRKIRDFD